jgi:hypothetical protein
VDNNDRPSAIYWLLAILVAAGYAGLAKVLQVLDPAIDKRLPLIVFFITLVLGLIILSITTYQRRE